MLMHMGSALAIYLSETPAENKEKERKEREREEKK